MTKPPKERSILCETHGEEIASMVTHIVGTALAIAALVIMIVIAQPDPWKITAASIFGSTLVILYLSSTLYHSFSGPRTKSFFQIIDHSAIYLLIAGTYTPLTLVTLRPTHPTLAWSILIIVWVLAIGGIVAKSVMKNNREHWISTALYLFMGWLIVFAVKPVLANLPTPGLILLVAGGLCYSGGVAFFIWEKLKFNHSIWHLFVMAGSVCHALATMFYIL